MLITEMLVMLPMAFAITAGAFAEERPDKRVSQSVASLLIGSEISMPGFVPEQK